MSRARIHAVLASRRRSSTGKLLCLCLLQKVCFRGFSLPLSSRISSLVCVHSAVMAAVFALSQLGTRRVSVSCKAGRREESVFSQSRRADDAKWHQVDWLQGATLMFYGRRTYKEKEFYALRTLSVLYHSKHDAFDDRQQTTLFLDY